MKQTPFLFLLGLLAPMATMAAPTNVALNKPAQADSLFNAGYPADKAVDGNSTEDASRWISGEGPFPHWIELDLQQNYVLSRLRFWTGKNHVDPFPLTDFALQHWDGTAWTDLYAETASANTGEVDATFGPVLAGNRVRLHVTDAAEDSLVRLFEMEIHGEPHGLTFTSRTPNADSTVYDPATEVVLAFNTPVTLQDASGIRIVNTATATDVSGLTVTVSGTDLILSHGGLPANERMAVHIPANAVHRADDAGTANGPVYWEFDTAPLTPQATSHSKEIPNLTDPVTVSFDREITAGTALSDLSLTPFAGQTQVTGLSASVSGPTLTLAHDGLSAGVPYLLEIPAGAVEAAVNGQSNDPLSLVVYGGSTALIDADFTDGMDGFQTAYQLGLLTETNANIYWKRRSSGAVGPDYDEQFLTSQTNYPDDFVVSPRVDLEIGQRYFFAMRASLNRTIKIGITPTPNLQDVRLLHEESGSGNKTIDFEFIAETTESVYFIFYRNSDINPWQDQEIDAVSLTQALSPLVRIKSPLPTESFIESASIPVEVEAFGITGEVVSLEIFDNGESRASFSGSGPAYQWNWDYHNPGFHNLRAVATDSFGNEGSAEQEIEITFDDGTLPKFIEWSFENDAQNWTFSHADHRTALESTDGRPGYHFNVNGKSSDGLSASSPEVFLRAGETYTVQFLSALLETTNSVTWSLAVTPEPGYPAAAPDTKIDFRVDSVNTWVSQSLLFTVPADGGYHLTLYQDAASGYNKLGMDNIRLIGNFNSVPSASWLYPEGPVVTFAGASAALSATAGDADGTLESVAFRHLADNSLVDPAASLSTEPYSFTWENLPEGVHEVYVEAVDNENGRFQSETRQITAAANPLSLSTYFGGPDTDEHLTAAAYLSDGTLVVGGVLDPALVPGVTPRYLNGSSPGDRGIIMRLTEEGTGILSLTVVGQEVSDLAIGGDDRIHVAAMAKGAVVLNPSADTVLWSQSYSTNTHRIDAANTGTFAVLNSSQSDYRDSRVTTATNYLYDASFAQLATTGGASAFTTDVAVDPVSQRVVFIGYKNVANMIDPSPTSPNPVDIPAMVAYSFDGTRIWRAYDWENQDSGDRWLNLPANNMADTRGARVIAHEGTVYAGIEFDGGNTPLRYDPFDITRPVSVVGGDAHHTMANTSTAPKVFIGKYDAATGAYQTGQWITNRQSDGSDNTIRIENGNLLVDHAGRIHVVGWCASGLPMTHDPLPGQYDGGGYHLVYSPDFTSRELVTRLSVKGDLAAIALSPSGTVALAGETEINLFTTQAFQDSPANANDAILSVGNFESLYQFQSGNHPRLFFSQDDLPGIRSRLDREPFASMLDRLIAERDFADFYRPTDPASSGSLLLRAKGSAFLYALTGDEAYAVDARNDLQDAFDLIDSDDSDDWATPAIRGLTLYSRATNVAIAYDLCSPSPHWEDAFTYDVSKRLREIAEIIVSDGGTGQPADLGSNWYAGRGASAGIALLATDHAVDDALPQAADAMVGNYLNTNQGPGAAGWNPEGFGYTAYPVGYFVGPYAVASDFAEQSARYAADNRLTGLTVTGFMGATTAYDIYGTGGVKTDWSDDNGHTGGEGIYGLAFYFAPTDLLPALRHAYDRFMGNLSPHGPNWDSVRHGTFWSLLFYPDDVAPQDPLQAWGIHQRNSDPNGIGLQSFRNAYQDQNDVLLQFKAKTRTLTQAHDGADGLGLRFIGLGDAFIIGGGRNSPGNEWGQATVYPNSPDIDFDWQKTTGELVGNPLLKPDGGGHAIARMDSSSVRTTNHKRWVITDFAESATGAHTTVVVADTSDDGRFWQLPTFLDNSIATNGNEFTITGTKGATLRGTVLHPSATPAFTTGTKARGSGYTLENGGTLASGDPVTNPRITDNRYLFFEGNGDGQFLVVMTLQPAGQSHPAVSHVSGGVADATVQVGSRTYTLQTDDVLYDGAAYSHPDAVVTFDAGSHGSLGGAAVQTVPYGGSATAPIVSPDSGYLFSGWDKAFSPVVTSMTVSARYQPLADSFASWITDPEFALTESQQGPDDNPDQDTFTNLMEYALALDPSRPDGQGVVTVRYQTGEVVLAYRVREPATGLSVTPQVAHQLHGAPWSAVDSADIRTVGSGPGYTSFEASVPLGTQPVFLRLQVTTD